ncbi:MAG TPA: HAD family hydrolase, partial [Rhodocyclaceae bacterium]
MTRASRQSPLHIMLINVHGLLRGHNPELGRDSDTGGQIVYVLELAKALDRDPAVGKIDVLTRQINDPEVDGDYRVAEESLGEKTTLLRLPCGPEKYLRKELLWPHLDQMVDRCLVLLRERGRLPDLIHSHYADAGYVGRQLSLLLGIPQIHTGHSLGRPKRARLLASGRKAEAIDRQYHFDRRIDAEEDVLYNASLVITSTRQEIDEQYGLYRNSDRPRFAVIPPGTDTERFSAPGRRKLSERLLAQIDRFLSDHRKPIILTIARADARKNLGGLLAAFAGDRELRERANLVIVAGSRANIREMDSAQSRVLQDLLLDIDLHDLWGSVAIPKEIAQEDIPDLYRLVARRHGVFVNSALTEPFGLTLIEAAASGLPIIAPDDGGPRDIIANCRNGVLVDTLSPEAIASALKSTLGDQRQLETWAANGLAAVQRHYSWAAHTKRYLKEVRDVMQRERKQARRRHQVWSGGKSTLPLVRDILISDIDNTLIGDGDGLSELTAWLQARRGQVGFGIATGRTIDSTLKILKKWRVGVPDVLVTAVGSEIYYGPGCIADTGWSSHIRHLWRRDELATAMTALPGLELQAEAD